jgi:FHA domain
MPGVYGARVADPELLISFWRRAMHDPANVRALLKTPAIVWEGPSRTNSDIASWEMTHTHGAKVSRPAVGEALVYQVEKNTAVVNPFPMGVTLGRVDSNDLVLDDASVSRFHAYLQLDERSQRWSLTDAESRNGTWVDGQRSEAGKRVAVRDGSELRLGEARLRFFLPEGLIAFVLSRDQASKR